MKSLKDQLPDDYLSVGGQFHLRRGFEAVIGLELKESKERAGESAFWLFLALAFSAAYKHADGKKFDGRRVLVDVERARTVNGWLPRRLGES